jgi:peptidoglycan/LPS O-acetylase OafA/YrhL
VRAAPKAAGYIADIQVLRCLAVTVVVMQHFATWFSLRLPGTSYDLNFLWIGVDLFFVISAFLIVSHLLGNNIKDQKTALRTFWLRRFWRLLPAAAFWALVASGLAISMTGLEGRSPFQVFAAAASGLLGLSNLYWPGCSYSILPQTICSGSGPFGVYWSLSLEEQFYLMASLTIPFGRFRLFMALLLAVCLVNLNLPWDRPWSIGWSIRPYGIAIGCMLAFAWHTSVRFRNYRIDIADRLAIAAVAGPLIGLLAAFYHPLPTAIACGLCGVLTWLALMDRCFSRSPVGRAMEWIGERSYSIYLCHMGVLLLVREFFIRTGHDPKSVSGASSWLILAACYIVILLLAHCSYQLIEQRYRLAPRK